MGHTDRVQCGGTVDCAPDGSACICLCSEGQAEIVQFLYDESGCLYNQNALDLMVLLATIVHGIAFIASVGILFYDGRAGFRLIRQPEAARPTSFCAGLTRRRNVSLVLLVILAFSTCVFGVLYRMSGSKFAAGHDVLATVLWVIMYSAFWFFLISVLMFNIDFYLGRASEFGSGVKPTKFWMLVSILLCHGSALVMFFFHIPDVNREIVLRFQLGLFCLVCVTTVRCVFRVKHDLMLLFNQSIQLLAPMEGKEDWVEDLKEMRESLDSFLFVALIPSPFLFVLGTMVIWDWLRQHFAIYVFCMGLPLTGILALSYLTVHIRLTKNQKETSPSILDPDPNTVGSIPEHGSKDAPPLENLPEGEVAIAVGEKYRNSSIKASKITQSKRKILMSSFHKMRVQIQMERTPAPISVLPVQNLGMSKTAASISIDNADYLAILLRRESRSSDEKNVRFPLRLGSGSTLGTESPKAQQRSGSTRTPPPRDSSTDNLILNMDAVAEPSDRLSNPMDLRDFAGQTYGDPEHPMDLSAFSDYLVGSDSNYFSTKH